MVKVNLPHLASSIRLTLFLKDMYANPGKSHRYTDHELKMANSGEELGPGLFPARATLVAPTIHTIASTIPQIQHLTSDFCRYAKLTKTTSNLVFGLTP